MYLGSAVQGLVFRVCHLQLWLLPILKVWPYMHIHGLIDRIKGVISYWVVLACENELHHQPVQISLLRPGHASDFGQVATEVLGGFTK